jgi:hypothetical protein
MEVQARGAESAVLYNIRGFPTSRINNQGFNQQPQFNINYSCNNILKKIIDSIADNMSN